MSKRFLKRLILLTIFLILVVFVYLGNVFLRKVKSESLNKAVEVNGLKSQIEIENNRNEDLKKSKIDNVTKADLEELARKDLGLIKKDEIVIKPK